VFGESPPSNHVGWLMGATPPEMNGLYGTSPLYGGSGGSSGKRGGYLSSSPRGAHPSRFQSLGHCAERWVDSLRDGHGLVGTVFVLSTDGLGVREHEGRVGLLP
jgi:hypothetical protein